MGWRQWAWEWVDAGVTAGTSNSTRPLTEAWKEKGVQFRHRVGCPGSGLRKRASYTRDSEHSRTGQLSTRNRPAAAGREGTPDSGEVGAFQPEGAPSKPHAGAFRLLRAGLASLEQGGALQSAPPRAAPPGISGSLPSQSGGL